MVSEVSHLSILAYSFLPFCVSSKSPIHQVVEMSEREICGDIDFIAYLGLFREVKKLKSLVLGPEQRVLFDRLSHLDLEACARPKSATLEPGTLQGERAGLAREEQVAAAIAAVRQKPSLSDIDKTLLRAHGFEPEILGASYCNL